MTMGVGKYEEVTAKGLAGCAGWLLFWGAIIIGGFVYFHWYYDPEKEMEKDREKARIELIKAQEAYQRSTEKDREKARIELIKAQDAYQRSLQPPPLAPDMP